MPSEVSVPNAAQASELTVDKLKRELAEAHRREAATAAVLKAISRSTFNLQDVLDSLIESAVQLTGAETGLIIRQDGEAFRTAAIYGATPEFVELAKQNPIPPGRQSATGRAVLGRRVVHIPDVLEDREYAWAARQAAGVRTILAVPMLRGDTVVGVIGCGRREVRPFTAKEIDLVQIFADQAVIAIENTRLFGEVQARTKELTESLEYQTATSEVLSVISKSPNNLQPVLDAIVVTAQRLCQAEYTLFSKREGDGFYHIKASVSADPLFVDWVRAHPIVAGDGSMVGIVAAEREAMHFPDCLAEPRFTDRGRQQQSRARTMLGVPLLHGGDVIGVIFLARTVVQPFTDRQIALVTTFANQAIIAIENARLFEAEQASKRELRESLDYQTAISEVLSIISRSQTDLGPIFGAILESAVRLCGADQGGIGKVEDGMLVPINWNPDTPETKAMFRENFPRPVDTTSLVGRAIIEGRVIHVPDVEAPDAPLSLAGVRKAIGMRSQLSVPLIKGGEAIGVIALVRKVPVPFAAAQIDLVTTFADQAVIAIENTRLFEEVQARTRELAKTVEDLEIASQHKSQFVANMSHELRTPLAAILGYAELMQEGFYGNQSEKSMDALSRIRSNGKHLLGLINTVLDIAKIESGQFTLNMSEYAIESIVETVRSATESLAQNKKLALKTEVAKSLPIGLGDEQRLTQVLLNLVGNAIKFTDTGEVCVTAKTVNGHFNLSVSDTGPGIPAEHQTRIFDQFHQVDSSNTKAKGGTGLGLAIAKQIVEMHGGRIWVESILGKGSTFHMELPTRAEFRKMAP